MSREKLFLVVLMLALSIAFTKSQADESMVFFTDIHSIVPSPTPQQQDGFSSSPLGIFLLPIATNFNSQYLSTSTRSSNFVLPPSNNPTSSQSSPSYSSLPSKSSSILGSTSTSVISKLPSLLPSATPTTVTPPILTTSMPSVAPSTMLIFSPVNTSTAQSFTVKASMTADGILTPGSHIQSTSSIVRTGSDPTFSSTTVRMSTESSVIQSTSMVQVSSISLSSTVMATTSPPVSMETTAATLQMTTEDVIIDESTKEEEDLTTRSTSNIAGGASISTPAVIGMVVAACLALIATALLILVLCYCFCRSRKYEYRTGNEYRVTVQKWNAHYAHYTANQCDSVSSSRGSSIMSSFGFRSSNGKMKPRYGGVSSSTDHIHTGATAEMYSTPL